MWTDPSDLLAKHQHLLEEDFVKLGKETAGTRQHWIASMESALAAADHVRSGKEYWGEPGTFAPTRHTRYMTALRHSSRGSHMYRRYRVTGTRHSRGVE